MSASATTNSLGKRINSLEHNITLEMRDLDRARAMFFPVTHEPIQPGHNVPDHILVSHLPSASSRAGRLATLTRDLGELAGDSQWIKSSDSYERMSRGFRENHESVLRKQLQEEAARFSRVEVEVHLGPEFQDTSKRALLEKARRGE